MQDASPDPDSRKDRSQQLIEENRRLAQRCLELEAASRSQLEKLRAANAVLTRGEADLRALLENAAIGFALTDLNLRVASANQTLAGMLGYGAAELPGVNFTNFVYVGKLPAFNRIVGRDSRASVAGEIIELVARDGALHPCRVVASDWRDENGASRGHFLLVLDAGPELALAVRLRDAEQSAAEAEKSHSLLLEAASREFRAPLGRIADLSRTLMDAGPDDRPSEPAGAIHASAVSLARMLGDLIDAAGPVRDGALPEPSAEPVDVRDLAQGVAGLFALRAGEKGLELRVAVAPDVPGQAMLDPRLLMRALAHLADNAVAFTEKGGVTLSVDVAGRRLRFMVSDTGPGVDPDADPDIDPETGIERAESGPARSRDRRRRGIAAGLAICRRLVSAMGGAIGHESEPGRGSESHFTLPLVTVQE